jgi:membrane protein
MAMAPKRDWRKILVRVARDTSQKHLTFVAAGAAFYAFLTIPAALAVLASLSLLIFDPGTVQRGIRPVEQMVPPYVIRLLSDPHSRQTLSLGLLFSLIIDLGSVHSGSSCMLTALTLVDGKGVKRSFISRQLTVLVLAAVTVPFMLLSLILILVLPEMIDLVPFSPLVKTAILVVRWPILMALFMTVLAAVYRYAPHRTEQCWRWMSWGSVLAMASWIVGSAVFSVFVVDFVSYDPTYGMLGLIIALLAWLNFTALTILLGAQIDAEIEREAD